MTLLLQGSQVFGAVCDKLARGSGYNCPLGLQPTDYGREQRETVSLRLGSRDGRVGEPPSVSVKCPQAGWPGFSAIV